MKPLIHPSPSFLLECEREAYKQGYAVGYTQEGTFDENPYSRPRRRGLRLRLQCNAWERGWFDGSEAWIKDHPSDCLTTSLQP
jgi:hypothetical protein